MFVVINEFEYYNVLAIQLKRFYNCYVNTQAPDVISF